MMSASQQQRIDELFVAAIDQPASEQAKFIEAATESDPPEVRERVLELLGADQRAGVHFAARSPLNLKDLTTSNIRDPRIGQRIGEFELLSRIASGGFGTVYRATRQTPYREDVAIKLLHHDSLAAPSVVRRVLREMQALSDLRHPNIVSQLQSNVSHDGEPYIVMELIDGLPLDAYCNQNQLSIEERLRLFQTVCNAVEFAHQQGWVHRDLKPSNILVTKEGVPKLLDFGIAKLSVSPADRLAARETVTQGPVGTPQYMSPEQFAGDRTGPPADVYALGAILYELTSGHRAFDVMCRGVDTVMPEAVRSAVRDSMPSRPSTVVNSHQATETGVSALQVAVERRSNPSSLKRCLQGDVDNIAMMALRKEPARRYPSAADVATDIQHWLEHRPVVARPDSVNYRVGKFLRRNQIRLAVAAVISVCLATAVMGLNQGRRATVDRDHERVQRFVDAARTRIDEDDIPAALVQLHAAYKHASNDTALRDSVGRLIFGWSGYLGQPLGSQANIHHTFGEHNRMLAVAQRTGSVAIWNTLEMQPAMAFDAGGQVAVQAFSEHERDADSPTQSHFVTATDAGRVRCWDLTTQDLAFEHHHDGEILAARVSRAGVTILLSASSELKLFFHQFATVDSPSPSLRELATRTFADEVFSAQFLNQRQLLVYSKSEDARSVELWDANLLTTLMPIVDEANGLGTSELSPDSTSLAIGYRVGSELETVSKTVIVDLQTLQVMKDFRGRVVDIDARGHYVFRERGRIQAGGPDDDSVRVGRPFAGLWDAHSSVDKAIRVAEVRHGPRPHTLITLAPFATADSTQARRLFHPFFSTQPDRYDRSQFGPRGQFVVFDNRCNTPSTTRVPWLWSLNPYLRTAIPNALTAPDSGSALKAIAVDDAFMVAMTSDGVQCWDLRVGTRNGAGLPTEKSSPQRFGWQHSKLSPTPLTALTIATDIQQAVTGDANGSLNFLSLPTLEHIRSIKLFPGQAIRSVAIHRNGTKLLVATQNETRVYALESLHSNQGETAVAETVVKRANSAILAAKFDAAETSFTVASRQVVRACDLLDGHDLAAPLDLHDTSGRISDFTFNQQRPVVAILQSDYDSELDVSARSACLAFSQANTPVVPTTLVTLGKQGTCTCMRFSPDGNVVAVGHSDGTIQFWDTVMRCQLSKQMQAGKAAVDLLSFSLNGETLISATRGGELRLWNTGFRHSRETNQTQRIELLTGFDLTKEAGQQTHKLDQASWNARFQASELHAPALRP